MLQVDHLSVFYAKHQAVSDVSVTVDVNEIVVILGANGAGKSSLLKAVAAMCEGTVNGDITLQGASLAGLPAEQIVERGIAFVPEGRGIFPDLSVEENLSLGAWTPNARANLDQNLARVQALFPKLAERRKQIASTMSGGEQQMVAIGRALMSSPQILMLDEPSLGLSPLLCKELFQSLSRVRDAGMGVLLVEQNARQSLAIADRGYLLENGSITGQNSAQALLSDPAVQAAYLGGAAGSVSLPHSGSGNHAVEKRPTTAQSANAAATPFKINPPPAVSASADQLINTSIGDLVDRAAQQAADSAAEKSVLSSTATGGKPYKSSASSKPRVHYIQPEPELSTAVQAASENKRRNAASGEPAVSTTHLPAPAKDPEVAALLETLETAANNARQRSSGRQPDSRRTLSQYSARQSGQSTPETADEPLPEIKVYRRNPLQVWKRGTDGKLKRQR